MKWQQMSCWGASTGDKVPFCSVPFKLYLQSYDEENWKLLRFQLIRCYLMKVGGSSTVIYLRCSEGVFGTNVLGNLTLTGTDTGTPLFRSNMAITHKMNSSHVTSNFVLFFSFRLSFKPSAKRSMGIFSETNYILVSCLFLCSSI